MFYGHAANLLSLKKWVVIEVSRQTFCNAKLCKIIGENRKSQKMIIFKNFFMFLKMRKNITFMHENLTHIIKRAYVYLSVHIFTQKTL